MPSVNISIKKDAYDFLKSLKAKNKSFSDIILQFKHEKGSKESIMRFWGALNDDAIDWEKKESQKLWRGEKNHLQTIR